MNSHKNRNTVKLLLIVVGFSHGKPDELQILVTY